MPEGHVLHRLARLHQRRYGRRPVTVGSPQGRFGEGAGLVDGAVLRRADAWGKHLFHHYDNGRVVHVHLGIYGAFFEFALDVDGPPEPIGQVRMRMLGADYGTDLRGPMVCEVLDEGGVADVLDRLGPDPLRADADPQIAWRRISKSRRSIGSLLMDQSVFAGVGNIYRSEVLFRHGIDPMRPGAAISTEEFDVIWADLVAMMKVGQRDGQIVVVRPADDHGAPSYRAGRPRTYVYRRSGEPCRICRTPVLTSVLEGRNLFWCPTCQT